jgi:ATP-dependent DNA helicase RecG
VLDEPLKRLVGDRTAKVLRDGLGLSTVGDLLRHYPRRYAARGELTDLRTVREGEHVTVLAQVASATLRPMRARRGFMVEVVVTDGTPDRAGRLTLTFFGKQERAVGWRLQQLRPGRTGLFSGKVSVYRGNRQLTHPDYVLVDEADDEDRAVAVGGDGALDSALADDRDAAEAFSRALIPVYPATAALPSWRVAKAVRLALDTLGDPPDPVPPEVRDRHDLVGLAEAFRLVHEPATLDDVARGLARLRFEEAYVLQVELARRRAAARALPAVPRRPVAGGVLEAFDARLPFTLTEGQREVGAVIEADLARAHPMQRLLQGEVGSGKTVVAVRAMLTVVDSGGQAALLAPTEVLAQQHHRSLSALLGPLAEHGLLGGADVGTRLVLLTGATSAAGRRRGLLEAASGEAGIVIGTHALLEERVGFADLGLVVVDEQHRFGVEQRAALAGKGVTPPHVLVMTATPIPRTVAMTVFGDLEVSTLTELPAGRQPLETHVVPPEKPAFLARAWERVREEVAAGHQAYVVAPRIGDDDNGDDDSGEGDSGDDDSGGGEAAGDIDPAGLPDDDGADRADAQPRRPAVAVLDVAPALADGPLAGLRLEVLHGRLPAETKDGVMRRFADGDVDVLVATTVVEVGVDVPNATAMVVLDADRFGVSQLHQLRGRVGRGTAPGLCLLVTDAPDGSPARERLDAVARTLDGFALSRVDLENRREGDVLGASQSGRRSSLRLLSVLRDEDLIARAREEATGTVEADPELVDHPALLAAVEAALDDDRADYLDKS